MRIYNRKERPNYTPEHLTELKDDEVFVFGSNLEGKHEIGEALRGQSYAIPIIQGGLETIKPHVDRFINYAKSNQDFFFYVTKIGFGTAGLKDEEIAPLFSEAYEIENICLPRSFVTSPIVLKSLGKMPLFRLSLGSKELFHSNFLEFLWDFDRSSFIGMIRELLNDQDLLPLDPKMYSVNREKEHFDIAISHLVKVNRRGQDVYTVDDEQGVIVYDLILENKVKSIPYKQQLDGYVRTIKEKNKKREDPLKSAPRYVLLSLAKEFPDNSADLLKTWTVVHYDALKVAIEKQTWPQKQIGYSYIQEYCDLIRKLHDLSEVILHDLQNESLFQDVKVFEEKRIHDLYIKLRCTSFMMQLKARLEADNVPVSIQDAKPVRKQSIPAVYLNVNVFNAVGQVGALVWTGKDKADIYEIIVQGNQFRHGINQYTEEPKKPKVNGKKAKEDRDILNKMWIKLSSKDPSKSFLHTIRGITDLTPKVADTSNDKIGPYDDYDNGYIYRYISCKDWPVSRLLDEMADEIKQTAKTLRIID